MEFAQRTIYLLVIALFPMTVGAQQTSNERRISDLERRVKMLEEKLSGTEAAPSAPVKASARGKGEAWRDVTLWRSRLARGQSKEEVRGLLGEPTRIVEFGSGRASWYYGYPVGGRVEFDERGRVESWGEP